MYIIYIYIHMLYSFIVSNWCFGGLSYNHKICSSPEHSGSSTNRRTWLCGIGWKIQHKTARRLPMLINATCTRDRSTSYYIAWDLAILTPSNEDFVVHFWVPRCVAGTTRGWRRGRCRSNEERWKEDRAAGEGCARATSRSGIGVATGGCTKWSKWPCWCGIDWNILLEHIGKYH